MRRLLKKVEAISRLSLILLMLGCIVFGAALSYVWVMGIFYNVPLETVDLCITDVNFPAEDARRFNVTVLNPSYSISDAEITGIGFTVEDSEKFYEVSEVDPSLPFTLERGHSQTFICDKNWGDFAGKTITVHVIVNNASGPNFAYKTSPVRLTVSPYFRAEETVERFNLTVTNSVDSVINLTVSEILVGGLVVEKETVSPEIPYVLAPGENVTFVCDWKWAKLGGDYVNVTVNTEEGYKARATTHMLKVAYLEIKQVEFDETDTSGFYLTVENLNASTALANLVGVEITLDDGKTVKINETVPGLEFLPPLQPNGTTDPPIKCLWDWTNYRNRAVNVTVYTKQGFTVPPKSAVTPPGVILRIEEAEFNLTDTNHFNLTVKNLETSLQNVDLDKIEVQVGGDTETVWDGTVPLNIGDSYNFSDVEWNWTESAGKTATITVYTAEGFNVSYSVELPCVKLEVVDVVFANFSGLDYFNITVRNDAISLRNVTLWEITLITADNKSVSITNVNIQLSPNGTELAIGSEITVSCTSDWKWSSHIGETITIRVLTREGYEATLSLTVEPS